MLLRVRWLQSTRSANSLPPVTPPRRSSTEQCRPPYLCLLPPAAASGRLLPAAGAGAGASALGPPAAGQGAGRPAGQSVALFLARRRSADGRRAAEPLVRRSVLYVSAHAGPSPRVRLRSPLTFFFPLAFARFFRACLCALGCCMAMPAHCLDHRQRRRPASGEPPPTAVYALCPPPACPASPSRLRRARGRIA